MQVEFFDQVVVWHPEQQQAPDAIIRVKGKSYMDCLFNPIRSRGVLGDPVFSQSFWANSSKFGDFS